MNRLLKFRIWSHVSKRMIPTDTVYVDKSNPEWIVMQFTGLFDKNGKEIYEGDILSILDWNSQHRIGFVEYKNAAFMLSFGWSLGTFTEFGGGKIIGNIFQNPDLIGGL